VNRSGRNIEKENLLSFKGIISLIVTLVMIIYFFRTLYLIFGSRAGFFGYVANAREIKNYEKLITDLKIEIADLEKEKASINEDDFYLEKVARERLGLIKENETIYRIIEKED